MKNNNYPMQYNGPMQSKPMKRDFHPSTHATYATQRTWRT